MKSLFNLKCGVLALGLAATGSAQTFTEAFSYGDGALVGTGGWQQIGAVATNPITVSGGAISLATSGQDIGNALGFSASSGSLYAGFDLKLSAAQSTGDYFFAFNTAATATNYTGRFFAKSTTGGYQLGYQLGVTNATPTYSSTVMGFNTDYRIVIRYDFVTGTFNDQGLFYINPLSATEGLNTSAISTISWMGTTTENVLAAVTLRQGTASSAATFSNLDNLIVSNSFATAANLTAIPEPSTYAAIFGALALGLVAYRRRRLAA